LIYGAIVSKFGTSTAMCLTVVWIQLSICGDVCLADPKSRAFQLGGWSIHGSLHISVLIKDECERIGNKLVLIMDEDISWLSGYSSCIKRRKKGFLANGPL
jgi:hypothetical protein